MSAFLVADVASHRRRLLHQLMLPLILAIFTVVSAGAGVDSLTCADDALRLEIDTESCHENLHSQALLQKQAVHHASTHTTILEDHRKPARMNAVELARDKTAKSAKSGKSKTATALKAYGVSVNEQGYKQIAALANAREMTAFVKRVAEELGYKITSPAKLAGVIPYYSGKKAKQSFKALKAELARTAVNKKGWAKKVGGGTLDEDDDLDLEDEDEEDEDDEEEES